VSESGIVVAGLYLLPALVWGIVADNAWRFVLGRRPAGQLFPVLALLASAMAVYYCIQAAFTLVPSTIHARRPAVLLALYTVSDSLVFVALALFRHMGQLLKTPDQPPRPAWLAVNYGVCAIFVAYAVALFVIVMPRPAPDPALFAYRVLLSLYALLVLAGAVPYMARLARPGAWRSGAGVGVARRLDVALVAVAVVGVAAVGLLHVLGSWESYRGPLVALNVGLGLLLAVPLALRVLGEVIRGLLLAAVMIAVTATLYVVAVVLVRPRVPDELRPLVDVGTVLAIVVALGPVQAWRRAWIDRVVFRRSRQRLAGIQAFVQSLSPELGTHECCRRALEEAARDPRLRGAAVLLADGAAMSAGTFVLEPLARVWPRGPAAESLPARSLAWPEFGCLPAPLREALIEADVAAVMPIASPRRRWGHLFLLFEVLAVYGEEDIDAAEAFTAQLALLLDAADLLARAVGVERSLAHAEKLAAIGETAARIAHEIRNPVAAARSLAQQLARGPGAPANAEVAELILAELERVERQVAALLRFARREELRREAVDLGALVRTTVEAFGPRLEAAGIDLVLDLAEGVVASADREKLRQVLVNLVENALDALGETRGRRRLALSVAGANGAASVRVTDTGPGVPPEALPRLFEPFFSTKEKGTGLGLAIARRTVEAHGGRIAAEPAGGAGMTFAIELPPADRP
jgi:signal transduction histidine kinase